MYSVRFGTARIFRPDPEIFEEMKKLSYRHLVSRFPEGEYHGVEAANSILQHQFRFYETRLHALAPLFASRGAAEFLLSQYDEAHSILHGKGIMDLEQLAEWRRIQPNFRRAIKYLVETICSLSWTQEERAHDAIALVAIQGALLAAEWMSVLSEMSSRVHSLSELDWQVTIFKEDGMNDFELRLSGPHKGFEQRFWDRTVRDRNSRAKFLGVAQFDVASGIHAEYLNPAFMESFGMKYQGKRNA